MVAGLSLAFVACGSERAASEPSAPQSRAQGLNGKIAADAGVAPKPSPANPSTATRGEAHSRSAPAVLVGWAGSPEKGGVPVQRLNVRIINTTAEKLDADVSVSMLAPGSSERTAQALGRTSLAPEGQVDLPLDVAALPVQTSGVATPLQVVVTYLGSSDITPPGASAFEQKRPLNTTYSPSLYITHGDDFRSATVRSEDDEARRNGELFRAGDLPALKAMKMNRASVVPENLAKVPVQRLVSVSAEFFPGPTQGADREESAP